jgi:RNA polymerase sigma-70 factor (family 1)
MKRKSDIQELEIKELQRSIAANEDSLAFKKLYFLFYLPLSNFAYALLKSKEQSEDLVSDLFLDLWSKRKNLESIENLQSYLYTSVRNNALKKLQLTKKIVKINIEDAPVELIGTALNAEDAIISNETIGKVEAVIDQLPPKCKLIFKLAKEDKLKYKQIAELLSISVKTIDNQLSTALKKIASVIQKPK